MYSYDRSKAAFDDVSDLVQQAEKQFSDLTSTLNGLYFSLLDSSSFGASDLRYMYNLLEDTKKLQRRLERAKRKM